MRRTARPGRNATAILAALMLFGAAACEPEASPDTGGAGDTGGATYPNLPRLELPPAEQAAYDATITHLLGSDGLSGAIATYWSTASPAVAIGLLYEPPSRVIAYEGRAQPSECGELSVENAWYCAGDSTIYYDDNMLRTYFQAFGPAGPTILLAHEWGHHLQALMGQPTLSVQAELQADCLAGMYVGAGFVPQAGDADLRGAGLTMLQLGDSQYSAARWFAKDVHGPASWRAKAFLDGTLGEGAYCRDYFEWEDRGTEVLGVYRWLPAPAIVVKRGSGDVLTATIRDDKAFIVPFGVPGAAVTATSYMPTVLQSWLPGAAPVGETIDVPTGPGTGGIIGGTGAVQGYQYVDDAGIQQHGVLFVHVASTGEAAIVSVVATGAPPDAPLTDAVWDPLLKYLFILAFSLCPPDGAGTVCLDLGGA